jgi:peptide chain release factor subunit 1
MSSGVPSKVKAVGQSAARFSRITEGLTKEFYKRIADEMKKNFFEMKKLKGIIVGGPVPTKDEFLEGGYLVTKLREKVIGVRDIGNSDESGIKDLVEASQDLLAEQEIIYEKKLFTKFFETLGKNPDKVVYDYNDVKKALTMGAVETLILSKKIKKEFIKELTSMANNISSKIEVVSTDTTEGEQFYNLSGIGALLRFSVQ